jgi:hypothetical protein
MQPVYYIGLDVQKQKSSYCVKDSSGKIYAEGWIPATRFDLDRWMKTLPFCVVPALGGPELWSADGRKVVSTSRRATSHTWRDV